MMEWFYGAVMAAVLKLREACPPWVLPLLSAVIKKTLFAAFACIFALGGALVGTIVGALKGQTTETGFVRGAGIGAVTGAVTALQLLELKFDGESLSKVALLSSVLEGKVFMEWVGPALLKAYQWQMSNMDTAYQEISDIYDTTEDRGLAVLSPTKLAAAQSACRTLRKERRQGGFPSAGTSSIWVAWTHG
ncbi:hypothetical protein SAY86_012105 [Trapa natans]|uniref:NEP1-interacting protein 1 n=1 Tax=Trapa natans TaxID=22666 RepID=A0AAN7LW83_TRANT|nr:hypothetical protein SAY86_012105 [Trapa natans]